MRPFNTDPQNRLDRLHFLFDQFLIPLAAREEADIPIVARVTCHFGCTLQILVVPSEWLTHRAGRTPTGVISLPSTDPQHRLYLRTGYCPSCRVDLQPFTPPEPT